jgi:hypothetical protein
MREKVVENSLGRFTFRRYSESRNFVCDRCLEPKVSKVEVAWERDSESIPKTICNGCFGQLSSRV